MIACWAWNTLYFPLVPLTWSLRAAGHEVVVATQPGTADAVRRSGLPVAVVGEEFDAGALMGGFLRRLAEEEGADPVEWREMRRFGPRNCWLGVAAARAMTGGLLEFARAWRPDVIVYEASTYAGPIVADLLGVPAVRHTYGIDFAGLFRDFEADALAGLCAEFGLGEAKSLDAPSIDPCPPSVQIDSQAARFPMRYVPYNGPGVLPGWLTEPRRRKRVCVSWGMSSGRFDPKLVMTGKVVRAIAGLDVDVVAAVSAADREKLGELPPNVRVVSGLPFHALFGQCDLVVSQGGLGTVMTAVAAGLPHLVLPQISDTMLNARMLKAAGSADLLLPSEWTDDTLAGTAAQMLADPAYPEAAARLRDEMHALPTPNEMAGSLAAIAG